MKIRVIFCAFATSFLVSLSGLTAFGQASVPPKELGGFWTGIKSDWMPAKAEDIWTDEQKDAVRKYCQQFAKEHDSKELVPAMIEDLVRRPSEVNAFIYSWVVLNWNAKEVEAILTPVYQGNDPSKKQVAADFIAAMEEANESERQ